MDILPAIDLRGAKVVRLSQGDYDRQKTYSDDPAAVAGQFAAAGASWIHMVDLDAARTGTPSNLASVRTVREAVDVKVELGGGARDDATIEAMLAMGVDRVVVGSAAMRDWTWFERLAGRAELAGKIALGLDARGDHIAVEGWTEQVDASPVEIARRVRGWPIGAIVYTDIARDGMLSGVNFDATSELIDATDVPIIASGGVGCIEDIARCRQIGCGGVIVGRAYYEGKINLKQALEVAAG